MHRQTALFCRAFALIGLGLSATGCAAPINGVDLLWLPPNTVVERDSISLRAGRNTYEDGSASVVFSFTTNDHEALTRLLAEHFGATGWRQRANQYLNPGMPTSFATGWAHRCACLIQTDSEGNPIPRGELREWTGEWENDNGDIITYSMFAEDSAGHGLGSFVPLKVARESLRRLQR